MKINKRDAYQHEEFSSIEPEIHDISLMINKDLHLEVQDAIMGHQSAKIRRISAEISSIWIRQLNRA